MNQKENNQAHKLLSDYCTKVETVYLVEGGTAVTAYWNDGFQKIFYNIQSIENHLQEQNMHRF